jgi:1-acyl-sn-glycerol-3-phosphate acyltransferase
VATGIAGLARRQIRALAKSSMWMNKLLGAVLTGMGQSRSSVGPAKAERSTARIEELRKGACIGIYPEATRSLGRAVRARGGVGYLARRCRRRRSSGLRATARSRFRGSLELARACGSSSSSSIDARSRPRSHHSSTAPGCSLSLVSVHPSRSGGARAPQRLVGRVPTWSPELAITGRPGGKGALQEALAQTAEKHS